MGENLPAAVPAPPARPARDTLGGAVAAASQLPGDLGPTVAAVAQEAFVAGMQVTSVIAAAVALGLAALAVWALRGHDAGTGGEDETGGTVVARSAHASAESGSSTVNALP